MAKTEKRWYGVSTGDGNNGVSHIFADYYVLTDDPWTLAERASASAVKPELHEQIEIDGEAEFLISAVVHDDPSFYDDYDPDADYSDWESGPASFILEVFPLDDGDLDNNGRPAVGFITGDAMTEGRAPMYDSIEEALG